LLLSEEFFGESSMPTEVWPPARENQASITPLAELALLEVDDVFYHPLMTRRLTVHVLPALFEPQILEGGIAVVTDVLRATTTIAYALQNGARSIVPCESIEEAFACRDETAAGSSVLLGGERGGEPIPGFDLGNSPSEWRRNAVADREIAFTTTNGTRALLRSSTADRILTGAFVNLQTICDLLIKESRPIHIVCAGTVGQVSTEDCLFAGAVVDRLLNKSPQTDGTADESFDLCDASRLVLSHWKQTSELPDGLFQAMKAGSGGRNLMRLGLEADIRTAATLDQVDLVPEHLPQSRRISRAI
jgi:2-phosphosulfolactate phosphatase